jgi:hypothetical protein
MEYVCSEYIQGEEPCSFTLDDPHKAIDWRTQLEKQVPDIIASVSVTVDFRSDFGWVTATGELIQHPYGFYVRFTPAVDSVMEIALISCDEPNTH